MSSAADRLRLKRRMGNAFEKQEPARRRFRATVGDGAGNVRVPGKKNHVYMRRVGRSRVEDILNVEVPARNGMPVICGADSENPDMLQILAVDWQSIKDAESFTYLPMHHESHELLNPDGGDDVVWVQKPQLIPLAPFPTSPASMQIWVQKDFYAYASTLNYWPGGLTIDFFATPTYLPHAYNGVYVTVSIDGATNALQYTGGTEFPTWPPPAEGTAIPAPPIGSVPIVAIYLSAGPNLLTNDPGLTTDSFETLDPLGPPPTFLYWSENLLGGAVAQDNIFCADGGAFSCKITEGGAATNVYQDITVVPGDNRQLRFWNFGDGANEGRYSIYDVTNGADIVAITATGHSAASWLEITQEYTVPAGCTTVRTYLYCPAAGGSDAWFDGVTDAQVPSSLSWSAMRDIRQLSSAMGGSVAPLPHDILSASHADTTPAAVVRGDLMTGQGVAPTWQRLAHPGAAERIIQSNATEVEWDTTTTGGAVNNVVRTDGVGAIQPNRLGVGTPPPNQNGVISQLEGIDPAGGGANTTRFYPKNDGGQSKYYFMDDAGEVYEIAGIVEDETVTVGGAGDFAAIQDAIDWFKHWVVKGDCKIEVDANTYDELLDFSDMLVVAGSTLTVEGDTRLLAGMSFFDGVMSNREGLNNAIAGTTDGVISLVGNGGQPVITVTNAGANNPDFDADAWVSGDKVLVYEWAAGPVWTATEYTIDSVLNNAITLTANLANGGVSTAGVGDDGAGITLLPNRRLESTVAGTAVLSDGVRGPQLDGFYIEPNANTDHGVNAKNGGMIVVERVVVRDAYFGIFADWINALVDGTGRLAAWECTAGTVGLSTAIAKMRYLYAIECIYGHWTERQAYSWPNKAVAINCTDGFRCERQSYMYPYEATARHCTMGYRSVANAMLEAMQTGNQNNGNTADYLPLPAGAGQYAESAADFGVLFYSM